MKVLMVLYFSLSVGTSALMQIKGVEKHETENAVKGGTSSIARDLESFKLAVSLAFN